MGNCGERRHSFLGNVYYRFGLGRLSQNQPYSIAKLC
jgi:hypothetical protein